MWGCGRGGGGFRGALILVRIPSPIKSIVSGGSDMVFGRRVSTPVQLPSSSEGRFYRGLGRGIVRPVVIGDEN